MDSGPASAIGQRNEPMSREVCEAALAHTLRDKTEAAYNRTDLFEQRRKLMNLWAVFSGRTGDGKRVAGKRTDNPSLQQVVSSRR